MLDDFLTDLLAQRISLLVDVREAPIPRQQPAALLCYEADFNRCQPGASFVGEFFAPNRQRLLNRAVAHAHPAYTPARSGS